MRDKSLNMRDGLVSICEGAARLLGRKGITPRIMQERPIDKVMKRVASNVPKLHSDEMLALGDIAAMPPDFVLGGPTVDRRLLNLEFAINSERYHPVTIEFMSRVRSNLDVSEVGLAIASVNEALKNHVVVVGERSIDHGLLLAIAAECHLKASDKQEAFDLYRTSAAILFIAVADSHEVFNLLIENAYRAGGIYAPFSEARPLHQFEMIVAAVRERTVHMKW